MNAQINAELIKLGSVRSLWILPVTAAVLMPALALFVGISGSLAPDDTILGGALTGAVLGLAIVGVWGALTVTSEYSSGTIEPTLAATPSRTRVLVAKAVVVGIASFVVSLVGCTAAFGVGMVTLDHERYGIGEPFPALVGVAVGFTAVALLGVAIGALVRSSVAATAIVVAVLILPELFGPLLGDLQAWVTGAAPSAVVVKLSQSADAAPEMMGSLGGWPSLMILLGYAIVALAAARMVFDMRDV
ncbi:ABC transporter permease subunit [Nocardia sp. XZ_19_231]|uniref:ABC transporter permease subunit n=1 Tax=Nocardia sp. XZ_19_231 TaxID=2769252 RepID=UPI00188F8FEA|nr:ABC transporter permease subunit [Nocardia sp. XZ_19_231]